ncbi:MAG: cysteine--tRNA ligase, partial [Candidatus Omnitrophota bacterium]
MKIYNSLTRTKEEFVPLKPHQVKMYVCGPTVYDEPHIGHARSAYIFDVVRRYLEYRGFAVTFVRNVTDVDDKIIEKARREVAAQGSTGDLNQKTGEVAKKYLDSYHTAMKALGIKDPTHEPKATEYIPKMIAFIEGLIRDGRAYAAGSDVYFDIKKAKGYGKLSNQSLEHMESGARVSAGEKKKDPLDFALWKSAKEGEPSWVSPWGNGRPGWHIECSAMSSDLLGDEFDIHGGGIDLIFPHHENEVAQSEGAGKKFARYWMHHGLLTISGEKMAKSLGNFITIQEFIEKYSDADYLKFLYLNTHYRHPVDYTREKILEAKKQKNNFDRFTSRASILAQGKSKPVLSDKERLAIDDFCRIFDEAMDDDFNTPEALACLFKIFIVRSRSIGE